MTCEISISVDVDTLHYYANFAPNGHVGVDPILSYTMPRLLDLFAELNIQATLFVIGETVADHRSLWQHAANAGHELASHSHTHPQAFHQLSAEKKSYEIVTSKQIIEDCTGQAVLGFRAPAYNIDFAVLDLLAESGYGYDSSFFPGWYVPLSKIVTRLLSRTYRPVPTSPLYWRRWWLGSKPFHWSTSSGPLFEIPLPTTRFGKPFFGTIHLNTSANFFDSEVRWLTKTKQLIPYELHPTEVADERVIEQAPWVRHIPGVGKQKNPWDYLRFRLQRLKEVGPIILLRDIQNEPAQVVPTRA